MKTTTLILILLFNACLSRTYIDTVYSVKFGTNVECGQTDSLFPLNIYSKPSGKANVMVPETDPKEILCLGLDGEIIIGLKDQTIINGDGADFKIFENTFYNPITKRNFIEPAVVSVSQDGINYIEFPHDINSLQGCAGFNPTLGDHDPFDTSSLNGDLFDLDKVNLDWIKYIKLKDISRIILENPKHKYFDPVITGFDLDAVAILNHKNNVSNEITYFISNNIISFNQKLEITVFDYLGSTYQTFESDMLNIKEYNANIFIVAKNSSGQKLIKLYK